MIVVTGATGFIGSNLVAKLNSHNFNRIIAVDQEKHLSTKRNLQDNDIQEKVERKSFPTWLEKNASHIEFIFHLGARTDTTEMDVDLLNELNTAYSQRIWHTCSQRQIPLIYASSAATYGDGSLGFSTDLRLLPKLQPLNPYGWSKHLFDLWVLKQAKKPFFWAGLKFFNVYGADESHKGRMASMIYQMEQQILTAGKVRLFKSYRPDFADGEQKRDFIHVNEVTAQLYQMMHTRQQSGIFNTGTGKARSFNEMAFQLFSNHKLKPQIEYIDMPVELRDRYQYFTEAKF